MKAENPAALERWLYWAMMDLAEESKARVRAEIETHYWESMEDHLRTGKSEEEAHNLALRSLGDSVAAGKKFSESYLTKEEYETIQGLTSGMLRVKIGAKDRWFVFLAGAALLTFILPMAFIFPGQTREVILQFFPEVLLFLAFLVIMGLLANWFMRAMSEKHPLHTALKKIAFGQVGFFAAAWAFLVWMIESISDDPIEALLWGISWAFYFGFMSYANGSQLLRLSRKLSRLGDDQPKPP